MTTARESGALDTIICGDGATVFDLVGMTMKAVWIVLLVVLACLAMVPQMLFWMWCFLWLFG